MPLSWPVKITSPSFGSNQHNRHVMREGCDHALQHDFQARGLRGCGCKVWHVQHLLDRLGGRDQGTEEVLTVLGGKRCKVDGVLLEFYGGGIAGRRLVRPVDSGKRGIRVPRPSPATNQ
ncbi:MAG: hypothetical protein WA830_23665 [Candidatus Sulfotelmatobacter sp.]